MPDKPTYEELAERIEVLEKTDSEHTDKEYQNLIENIPAIIYSYSTTIGGIFYSPQVYSILGYSPSSLLQNPQLWHDSIHPEDLDHVNLVISEFQNGKPFEVEYRIRDLKGNWLWFLDRSIGRTQNDGEIIIEGIATEITDRKQTEAKLLASERNMSIVLNSTQDCVVRIDQNFRHIYANSFLYLVTGLSPEQYLGKTNEEIGMPEDLCSLCREKHQKVFVTGQPEYFEFRFPTVNKGERIFQAAVCPEFNENKEVETIISFMRDITELKGIESEKDALITDLKNALAKIKKLEGLLPICSYCKKVRDDKGYWSKIETYIHKHSYAEFSHSICPECAKKYYPDMDIYDDNGEVTED